MRLHSQPPLFIGVLLILPIVGCGQSGPALGTVTGVVEMNGAHVPDVRVVFVPQSKGSPSYGATDKNGAFKMIFSVNRDGALVGEHSVLIEALELKKDTGGKSSEHAVKIPKKYEQPGALTASVKAGKNYFKFTLDPQ